MATFHFDLVSPEKLLFNGQVNQVDVPGSEGDFGVLAGHAPVAAPDPESEHQQEPDQHQQHDQPGIRRVGWRR